jgi:galactokinase
MHHSSSNSRNGAIVTSLLASFSTRFSADPKPRIFRAPGRVNLIGEHTDYNDGFVLPAAIDLYTWTAVAPRTDRKLVVFSQNLNQLREMYLDNANLTASGNWFDYIHGVALMLAKRGISVRGANLAVYSNVPLGAGLSSSAALEVSVASALLSVAGHTLPLEDIARLCQRAENEFVGARVGIMDQFASCFGSANKAILLDCRLLEYELLPLPPNVAMIICNSMVKHEHAGGAYNDRRAQCEEGVRVLQRRLPSIQALRDVSLAQLESCRVELSDLIFRRCHHVISENARVLRTVEALRVGVLADVGRCMADSHRSLREDFEVSCRELDILVDSASSLSGTIGSRMTGGGFGGCTINLVESGAVERFTQKVSAAYKAATHIDLEIYVCAAGAGVTEVSDDD